MTQHTQTTWVDRLQPGSQFISVHGETGVDHQSVEQETGPNAVGVILEVMPGEENEFSVSFDHGITGFISREEMQNPADYRPTEQG